MILFLTNNTPVTQPLIEWLQDKEGHDNVRVCQQYDVEYFLQGEGKNAEFIICYNYKYIISSAIIHSFYNRIVNLHISFLPWNRGASPNLWSFIEDTPKGVTIHAIDENIDTGRILCQRELMFHEELETLETSYRKLHEAIVELFVENWDLIKNGKMQSDSTMDNRQVGNYHSLQQTKSIIEHTGILYSDTIAQVKKKVTDYMATKRNVG